jgi:hypothetical protein
MTMNKYPKTFEENTEFRLKLMLKAANNPTAQYAMLDLCRSDILFWVNGFVATYNPRKNPSTIPFITYDYEDELILEIVDRVINQKDFLIDKSRDMGVTWSVLLVFTWFWQFGGEGFDFLVGSRKEQYIDAIGNMDTLFEKIRFIIRNQPHWMRPKGWDPKTHSNYLKIINPVTQATIKGEATNNNFSRGGRSRGIFFDEFAFWECDQAAWRASADSTNCRIVVSTPCGFNNQFAKLRFSNSIDFKSLHWTLHPEKDRAWYDNECKRRNYDAIEIAQELDINYEGSSEGVLFKMDVLKKAVHNQPVMSQDRIVVAIDPAGEGDDEAVIYVSNNGNIIQRKFFRTSKAPELAAECVTLATKHKAQVIIGDAIGNDVLQIVSSLLGENKSRIKVVSIKGSEKASDPIKFYNKRAEVYYNAAKQMESGNVQIDDDHALMTQLCATKFTTKDGRIILFPKEEVKKLISNASPDRADAWSLSVEGLKYTHSRYEVEQKERQRHNTRSSLTAVESGTEYGSWNDLID